MPPTDDGATTRPDMAELAAFAVQDVLEQIFGPDVRYIVVFGEKSIDQSSILTNLDNESAARSLEKSARFIREQWSAEP